MFVPADQKGDSTNDSQAKSTHVHVIHCFLLYYNYVYILLCTYMYHSVQGKDGESESGVLVSEEDKRPATPSDEGKEEEEEPFLMLRVSAELQSIGLQLFRKKKNKLMKVHVRTCVRT